MKEDIKKLIPNIQETELEQLNAFVESQIKKTENDAYTRANQKAYGSIDEKLKGLGFEKPVDMFTSDFVVNTISSKLSELNEYKSKLEKSLEGKDGKEKDYLQQIAELEKISKKKEGELKAELEKIKQQSDNELKKYILLSKFPKPENDGLGVEAENVLKNQAVNEMLRSAKIIDGEVRFYDEYGNLRMIEGKPMTAEDYFKNIAYLKPLFTSPQGKLPNPQGNNNPQNNNGGGKPNMSEVTAYIGSLRKQGLNEAQIQEMTKQRFNLK